MTDDTKVIILRDFIINWADKRLKNKINIYNYRTHDVIITLLTNMILCPHMNIMIVESNLD